MKVYYHHIPKTGGSFVYNNLINVMSDAGLKHAFLNELTHSTFPIFNENFLNEYSYFQGHFGTDPYSYGQKIESFTTLRHPVKRVVSHFVAGLGHFYGKEQWNYLPDTMNKFEEYLYSDKYVLSKSNFQARFLSNGQDQNLKPIEWTNENVFLLVMEGILNGWGISSEEPTFEKSINTLNKMFLIGTIENINPFIEKMSKWIKENFNIEYKFPAAENPNNMDASRKIYNNLTKKDIEKILELNQIDLALWEYANNF